MSKWLSLKALGVSITILLGASVGGCVSNPTTPQQKFDWYLGSFEGTSSGKNAKKLSLSCPVRSQCRLSMSSVSLAQVAAVPMDTTIAEKALAQTRRAYEGNPSFFDERFKQDVSLIRSLLAKSSRFEACVDVGSIRNMFFLCSTADDSTAQKGAVILGATLEPYSEASCRTKLYCEYYLIPVSRK